MRIIFIFLWFFSEITFKIAFSLDNKDVQEKFYCEKDFSAQEIYLLEKILCILRNLKIEAHGWASTEEISKLTTN